VPKKTFAVRFSIRLPQARSRVMSLLPPPVAKRQPLAKSAPCTSASTYSGISRGSAECLVVERLSQPDAVQLLHDDCAPEAAALNDQPLLA